MYIDEKLIKILEPHRGETIDVSYAISLIKTIAKEHETEQCDIHVVRRSALQWWITLSEIEKADFEFKTFDIIDHKGDYGELTINDITEMFRQHYA
ncbi:MAG: hypothetical protein GY739_21965 [Mesoflavibacter sp.]|nr:hypothetical protein [Mesoflavibacter sp.]